MAETKFGGFGQKGPNIDSTKIPFLLIPANTIFFFCKR